MRQAHAAVAVRVERKGSAVEDQFVLAADQVGVDGRNAGGSDPVAEHLRPLVMLFQVAGRGIEHQHQLGARPGCQFEGAGLPDVGADVDAAAHAAERDDARLPAGVEITLLVEDLVVRQADLAVHRLFRPVLDNRGGVVAAAVALFRVADDQSDAAGAGGQVVKRAVAGAVEIRAQQQVFRRITAQREFRRHQNLCTARHGQRGHSDDAVDVARQVADGGVELGNGDAQHGISRRAFLSRR